MHLWRHGGRALQRHIFPMSSVVWPCCRVLVTVVFHGTRGGARGCKGMQHQGSSVLRPHVTRVAVKLTRRASASHMLKSQRNAVRTRGLGRAHMHGTLIAPRYPPVSRVIHCWQRYAAAGNSTPFTTTTTLIPWHCAGCAKLEGCRGVGPLGEGGAEGESAAALGLTFAEFWVKRLGRGQLACSVGATLAALPQQAGPAWRSVIAIITSCHHCKRHYHTATRMGCMRYAQQTLS